MTKKKSDGEKWCFLPRELVRRHGSLLGVNGLAAYATLSAYADKAFTARLDYRKLHRKLDISNAEAVRSLHLLEELHLIRPERRKRYRLLWVPDWGKLGEKAGEKSKKQASPYRIDKRLNKIIDPIISIIDVLTTHINTLKKFMNHDYEHEEEGIEYPTDETDLAYELAEALDDREAIHMYLSYAHRFPEALLRETLVKVLAMPEDKIRKTRGALFNYLIQQYAAKKDRRADD